MVAVRTAPGLVEGLIDLAHTLESLDLKVGSLVEPGAPYLRDHLTRTIRHYLIPRLENPDIPLCVVLAGPTGSGKSTLVNSLSAMDLSKAGPIRPTTTGPVVVSFPESGTGYHALGGVDCEVIEVESAVLKQVTLVDTPDIDSTALAHRSMAEALIDSADVVVLVTSAIRYADEVPWEVLNRATARGATVIHVLNRVTPESTGAYVDLKSRLRAADLGGDVYRIPEHHLSVGQQSVPSLSVRRLAARLRALAGDKEAHQRRAIDNALAAVSSGSVELADALERAREWLADREDELSSEFTDAVARVDLNGVAGTIGDLGVMPQAGRRRKRWLKRNGIDDADVKRRLAILGRRLAALVEDDLGSMTLRPGDLTVQVPGIGGPLRSESLRKGVEAVVKGWFDYVARMTDFADPTERSLATLMIAEDALTGRPRASITTAGNAADALVARARREIDRRLESLYEAAGRRTLAQLAPLIADPHQGKILRRRAERVERFRASDA